MSMEQPDNSSFDKKSNNIDNFRNSNIKTDRNTDNTKNNAFDALKTLCLFQTVLNCVLTFMTFSNTVCYVVVISIHCAVASSVISMSTKLDSSTVSKRAGQAFQMSHWVWLLSQTKRSEMKKKDCSGFGVQDSSSKRVAKPLDLEWKEAECGTELF